mgnify:CR=1 FL=1|tara:strand:- start:1041 stop:1229 length:189 start_codon:yes stop_codon:yes gene_type:complete
MIDLIVVAFGLLIFLEGILCALFPSKIKNMMIALSNINETKLRTFGLLFAVIGFVIIWYFKS